MTNNQKEITNARFNGAGPAGRGVADNRGRWGRGGGERKRCEGEVNGQGGLDLGCQIGRGMLSELIT